MNIASFVGTLTELKNSLSETFQESFSTTRVKAAGLFCSTALPPGAWCFTHLGGNLCRWCEGSTPTCQDNVCFTNCTLSSFCTLTEEICIAIW